MAETYDKDAIKRQVEFYFSDSNFRRDAFLKAQAQANSDGYVEIKVLLTFNKLKALTTDVAAVAESLKDSEVVDVSADGLSIKRSAELPENDDSGARTVYVKGYPVDDETVTIESVKEQFGAYGNILLVRMRRVKLTKAFKGSVFIEFDNEKSVADVVAAANKDNEVQIGWKDQKFLCVMPYTEWAKRKEAKRKPTKSEPASGKRSADGAVKVEEAPAKVEFTPGLIFRVSELPTDATLYEIKDFFKAIADVKFVDYEGGNDTAHVRTADLAAATRVNEALKNGASLRETTGKLAFTLLEGAEEEAYWEKIAANAKNGGGRGGRGGGRGGRGGGRGGRGFKKARRN